MRSLPRNDSSAPEENEFASYFMFGDKACSKFSVSEIALTLDRSVPGCKVESGPSFTTVGGLESQPIARQKSDVARITKRNDKTLQSIKIS